MDKLSVGMGKRLTVVMVGRLKVGMAYWFSVLMMDILKVCKVDSLTLECEQVENVMMDRLTLKGWER